MENHDHRNAGMGSQMLISAGWYKPFDGVSTHEDHATADEADAGLDLSRDPRRVNDRLKGRP